MEKSSLFKKNETTVAEPLKIQKDEEFSRVKNIVSSLIIESTDVDTTKQLLEVYDYISKSVYAPKWV